MAEDPGKTKEGGTDLTAELAKYRDMAERYKKQRDETKTLLESIQKQSKEMEQALAELKAAEEKKKAESLEAKGEYEKLKSDWEQKLQELKAAKEKYETELESYRTRDQKEIEKLLAGREDAEELKAEIDGLPLSKQLSLARRLVGTQNTITPPSGAGSPQNRTGNNDAKVAKLLAEPYFQTFANNSGIHDEKELKQFAEDFIANGGEL